MKPNDHDFFAVCDVFFLLCAFRKDKILQSTLMRECVNTTYLLSMHAVTDTKRKISCIVLGT